MIDLFTRRLFNGGNDNMFVKLAILSKKLYQKKYNKNL